MMSGHQQTSVMVNVRVDIGVANLVKALSRFPELMTLESCERGKEGALVIFNYGTNWQQLVEFVFSFFGPQLAKYVGDDAGLIVRLPPSGPVADLIVRPGATERVSAAIRDIFNSKVALTAKRLEVGII